MLGTVLSLGRTSSKHFYFFKDFHAKETTSELNYNH